MLNHMILQGYLGRDPVSRQTQSGKAVVNFSVGHNSGTGDFKKTLFLECTAWEKQGEFIVQHWRKGKEIIVEGELQEESWEKDGVKQRKTTLNVRQAHFCGPKANGQEGQGQVNSTAAPYDYGDSLDDDIPF